MWTAALKKSGASVGRASSPHPVLGEGGYKEESGRRLAICREPSWEGEKGGEGSEGGSGAKKADKRL